VIASLDHLHEDRWAILQWLGKYLQKIALLIVVDKDFELTDRFDVLRDLRSCLLKTNEEVVVVCVGYLVEEHDSTIFHAHDSGDDILSAHRNVLDSRAAVVVNVLLDLRLPLSIGRLVDGHLDLLIEVSHHNRAQSRVLGVHHLVIYTPETMEVKHFHVPRSRGFHLTVGLVADAMIDGPQIWAWQVVVEHLMQVMRHVPWQEWALVVTALDERVDSVAVSLY